MKGVTSGVILRQTTSPLAQLISYQSISPLALITPPSVDPFPNPEEDPPELTVIVTVSEIWYKPSFAVSFST